MNKIKNPLVDFEKKWVALSSDNKKVLASGDTIPELEKKVKGINNNKFVLTWVPPFDKVLSLNAK